VHLIYRRSPQSSSYYQDYTEFDDKEDYRTKETPQDCPEYDCSGSGYSNPELRRITSVGSSRCPYGERYDYIARECTSNRDSRGGNVG